MGHFDLTPKRYVWLFPLLTAVIFPATFITTYAISVKAGTIKPLFSYISDTGAYPPAQGLFTLFLSIASMTLGATVWVRYKQIKEYFGEHSGWFTKILNGVGLLLGMAAALGTNMVGSFQETHSYAGHFTGAFLAFLGGGVYLIVQAIFTVRMNRRCLGFIRLIDGILVVVLFLVCFGAGTVSIRQYKELGGEDPTRWEKEIGAWELHCLSVAAEWLMALLLDVYIFSFVFEFTKISVSPSKYYLDV